MSGAEELAGTLAGVVLPGDMVVCLGAGDITKWAAGLAAGIEARGRELRYPITVRFERSREACLKHRFLAFARTNGAETPDRLAAVTR